jgi:hypothetical protein
MAREDIANQLRLTNEQLGERRRRILVEKYHEAIELQCRRQRFVLVNDFMPHELKDFNGPDFDYDESAQWQRGRILVVYKAGDDPFVSYLESPQGIRMTEDQSITLEDE